MQGPQLDVQATEDGILISLTDRQNFSMFAIGSAEPQPRVLHMMEAIAASLQNLRGAIVVRGHTDGRPYRSATYDNWRLSSARAQMAYYMLIRGGLPEKRFERVEGYADHRLKGPVPSPRGGKSPNRNSCARDQAMTPAWRILAFAALAVLAPCPGVCRSAKDLRSRRRAATDPVQGRSGRQSGLPGRAQSVEDDRRGDRDRKPRNLEGQTRSRFARHLRPERRISRRCRGAAQRRRIYRVRSDRSRAARSRMSRTTRPTRSLSLSGRI